MIQIPKRTIRFLKYGAPLMIFMLAASFGLAEFTDIGVKKKDKLNRQLTAEESKAFMNQQKYETLEEVYESMKDTMTRDDWENVRGPRVWEPETLKQLPTYKEKEE